ncbi:hypothetical protein A2348_01070 [Candidatus Uhrbacteria bacterium RIFOXYB12_FULL_58_10]|uniref:Dipeptidylpeptidase IV N-terminal domain-containing protein n=1 Tax=Candidatus Uhrbacteria bacterium RIFOXYB2_FULL_57_15 TaxID=1802422 RepID=A0A1F7W895_9BACT|nr:MAG: hypothetical protein A2348_01070 [Candidatus Uhrbacteria bacterium RIFOXYB12_FULL_58_10]OGL99011.1 MAG: hypothetical protein A2304_02580 [Candidatus Uhrbacteria bacterium RIFOXYB2_FULL_57_15]OGM00231.1 MAG: hypothetical protein A2501_01715 [Candidatus Uhrbacteria bacterium RIFOXYC12_FULL_57_11]
MNRYLALFVVVAIVAALAGVLYIRANVMRPESPVEETMPSESASDASVRYVVRSENGTVEIRAFDLASGTTKAVDPSTVGPLWPARYTQAAFICATADEATAPTALCVRCDIGRDNALLLVAYDGDKKVVTANIDPRDLGITPGAAEGYLVPVAVADDKSTIYLGRRVETESWVAGLWKLDVATGEVSEIEYVREHHLYQYDINPATKQLLGVTFVPPDGLGEKLSGPSEVHLVDLSTGGGRLLESAARRVFENPMFSDDGRRTAWYESGPLFGGEDGQAYSLILSLEYGRVASGWEINGIMKDWFGDTVVFDRDGNLYLYDLATKTETQITNETDATIEYVGVVR